jgi:hypothetical protein
MNSISKDYKGGGTYKITGVTKAKVDVFVVIYVSDAIKKNGENWLRYPNYTINFHCPNDTVFSPEAQSKGHYSSVLHQSALNLMQVFSNFFSSQQVWNLNFISLYSKTVSCNVK